MIEILRTRGVILRTGGVVRGVVFKTDTTISAKSTNGPNSAHFSSPVLAHPLPTCLILTCSIRTRAGGVAFRTGESRQ